MSIRNITTACLLALCALSLTGCDINYVDAPPTAVPVATVSPVAPAAASTGTAHYGPPPAVTPAPAPAPAPSGGGAHYGPPPAPTPAPTPAPAPAPKPVPSGGGGHVGPPPAPKPEPAVTTSLTPAPATPVEIAPASTGLTATVSH